MYRSASTTFFSSLPKTIKTLKMDIKSINGALEILGNSDMNLTELDFCDPYLYRNILMKPHQLKHVYKLTSLKTLKIPINSSIQERYRDTIISSTITNLVITCQNGLLYIDWVLEKFCCLQDLYIKHSKCSIRDSGLAQKVYPKLQSLAIRKCTIYPELLPYLKRVAPDMKNLKLDNIAIVSESKQRVYHIDISDFHLQRFHILLSYVGLSKKLKFYSQFIIQANNKELVHGSFGDIVSVIQNKDTLGKIDYITAIKDIHEKVDALEIGDS